MLVCDLQKPGLQIVIAGQKNVLRSLFTTDNFWTYLFLRLKLLYMCELLFFDITPGNRNVLPTETLKLFLFSNFLSTK